MYIEETTQKVRKYLLNIRPLSEFIHLNIFPDLTDLPFWQAMRETSTFYSFIPFVPMSFYQQKYVLGSIPNEYLENELNCRIHEEKQRIRIKEILFRKEVDVHFPEKTYRPLHKVINEQIDYSLNELSEPVIVRFLGNYYDQGFSLWKTPFTENGLLNCFFKINLDSFLPIYPLKKKDLRRFQRMERLQIIDEILSDFFDNEELKKLYIEECFLSLKGWSSFIKNIDQDPDLLLSKRKGDLYDFLAIRLIIEHSWIKKLKKNFKKIHRTDLLEDLIKKKVMLDEEQWLAYTIWHEAYEKYYHFNILNKLLSYRPLNPRQQSTIQAFFCIDDRECVLRSTMEKVDNQIETFGTPGHFGLDIYYQESKHTYPKKQCPAPLNANYIIENTGNEKIKKNKIYHWQHPSFQNVILEFFTTYLHGLWAGLKMLLNIFIVLDKERDVKPIKLLKARIKLKVFRQASEEKENSKHRGFTKEESALRLSNVFKSIGLKEHFAKAIFIIGHGATTTNNPYFTAYGCGACSGRTGNINAIAFCKIANDLEVRSLLQKNHGLHIPQDTFFIPGLHDTTKDIINLYDTKVFPHHVQLLIERFKIAASQALKKNAKIRCFDFESAPKNITENQALLEVKKRALSIFETRPELGHTRNALCIVGRRNSTLEMDFERRAFLQSYEPADDLDGHWLTAILSAAIPVCGGINLDYFYSKMNNLGVGAGSKLSHNIMGLFAVTNGTEDDLLPGLGIQMTELHEPMRIMMVVEQEKDIVLNVLKQNEGLWNWVNNEWVRFATISPTTGKAHYFTKGSFEAFTGDYLC